MKVVVKLLHIIDFALKFPPFSKRKRWFFLLFLPGRSVI